jgi:hypothetical protein
MEKTFRAEAKQGEVFMQIIFRSLHDGNVAADYSVMCMNTEEAKAIEKLFFSSTFSFYFWSDDVDQARE